MIGAIFLLGLSSITLAGEPEAFKNYFDDSLKGVDISQDSAIKACLQNGDTLADKVKAAYGKCFGDDYDFDDLASNSESSDSASDGLPDSFEGSEACFYKEMNWVDGSGNAAADAIKGDMAGLEANLKDQFDENINACSAWSGSFGSRKKRELNIPKIMENDNKALNWLGSVVRKTRSAEPEKNIENGKKPNGKSAQNSKDGGKGNQKGTKRKSSKKNKDGAKGNQKGTKRKSAKKNQGGKKETQKGKNRKSAKNKKEGAKGNQKGKRRKSAKKNKDGAKGNQKGTKRKSAKKSQGGKKGTPKGKNRKSAKDKKDGAERKQTEKKRKSAKNNKEGAKGNQKGKKTQRKTSKGNNEDKPKSKPKGTKKDKAKGKKSENDRKSKKPQMLIEQTYNKLWCFDLSMEQALEKCVEEKIKN